MATAIDELIEAIRRPELHPKEQLMAAERMLRDRLGAPLTSEEAAAVLGVTRPTVHAWVKAGLLRRSEHPGHRLMLDTATVYKVAAILETHHIQSSSLAGKVAKMRSLLDEITLASAPSLERALNEGDRGELIPYIGNRLARARLKAGQRTQQEVELAP